MYEGILAYSLRFQHTLAFSIDLWVEHGIDDAKAENAMIKIFSR